MEAKIISKFKEKPRTKTAWWAMGLGLSAIFIVPLLGIFASLIRPIVDPASVNPDAAVGFGAGGSASAVLSLLLSVAALAAGVLAFKKGERSWVL